MTVKEMAAVVGKKGLVGFNGLYVRVEVIDVRKSWTRIDYEVKVDGQDSNSVWVDGSRLQEVK